MDNGVRAWQDGRPWWWTFWCALVLVLGIAPAGAWAAPPLPGAESSATKTPKASAAVPPARDGYPHRTLRRAEFGSGARSYWLFEPADPRPERAPVVVFNHGWLAVNPGAYGAWIDHLVRSGNVVVYPRYQTDALSSPTEFLANAVAAVTDALDVLDTAPGHVRPDRDRFALIGHSAGGNLAAQMAAVAAERHLPKPRAVVALMPGEVQPSREPSLAALPAEMLLVVAAAEDDRVVGDVRARQIFSQASAVPSSRKKFVLYRTDLHGLPRLVAHHFSPTALDRTLDSGDGMLWGVQMTLAEVNALDRAGFWRLADSTLAAAFSGRTLDEATDRGELFRHLGYWSDGRVVERPLVGDDLAVFPRVIPTNGVRFIQWFPDRSQPPLLKPGPAAPEVGAAAVASPEAPRKPLERIAEGDPPTRRD
jgi:acetyl esterase/lipase